MTDRPEDAKRDQQAGAPGFSVSASLVALGAFLTGAAVAGRLAGALVVLDASTGWALGTATAVLVAVAVAAEWADLRPL